MNETQPALVNFTVETFPNERDMEFHLAQASKRFEVFIPRFKEAGLKKITSTKIWNKEGKAMHKAGIQGRCAQPDYIVMAFA